MSNLSEEFVNSTLIPPTPLSFNECLNGIHSGFIFFCCVMTFCFLLGTPANSWCLWFYFCIEQKVKQTHVFLLNHIIIELILCLVCAAQILNLFILRNSTFFIVIYFVLSLSWSGRPLIQTCICIEQYLAVLHPVTFLRYKGIKYRIAAVVAVWFMSLGYTLFQLTTMAFPDPFINSLFIITLAVISFCCVSVLCALKHPGPGDARTRNQTGRDVGNQQKRNAFNTIFSALILILFSYIPQALLTIFTGTGVDMLLFACNIVPFMTSFNFFGVIITPLLKLYKESNQKCVKYQKKIKVTG